MINFSVFENQKRTLIILIILLFAVSYLLNKQFKKISKNDLKVDINKANFEDLISIPYIGKKTAKEIIKIKKEKGYFNSINELKSIRNFKKFKCYIKAGKDAT